MHKLMEYVCDELEELERKAGKEGKLSMAETEYANMLTNMKKNLLKTDEMMGEGEFSMAGNMESYRGNRGRSNENRSYARNGRSNRGSYEGTYDYARGRGRNANRDAMGRYSSEGYSMDAEDMVEQLKDMMEDAPDEMTRKEFEKFIRKMEQM